MSRHYFVGSGIASLAGAAFLIRDAGVRGSDITVFEAGPGFGGALDAQGSAATGYHMAGSRMFEGRFECTADLMRSIPALSNPHISVAEESRRAAVTGGMARLHELDRRGVAAGEQVEVLDLPLQRQLRELLASSEEALDGQRILDCFSPAFFDTATWRRLSTPFALRRWHSAIEWRRYLRRYAGLLAAGADACAGVYRTRYNPYECLAVPLQRWLQAQGVAFRFHTRVDDLVLLDEPGRLQVSALHCRSDGVQAQVPVSAEDRVYATLGSMAADTRYGSMIEAAPLLREADSDAWHLWRQLATRHPQLGRPQAFCEDIDASRWTSFTVTTDEPLFFERMAACRQDQGGELIRIDRSGWLLALALYRQPFFQDQPDNVSVWWGYGLAHDRPGDHVRKPMLECTGVDILEEVLFQLPIAPRDRERIMAASNCIPCTMPYVTSPFLARARGDRPAVVPAGSVNLALLGQYVELPHEVALTVEYSVRSAQTAVYAMAGVDRAVPPVALDDDDAGTMAERLLAGHAGATVE